MTPSVDLSCVSDPPELLLSHVISSSCENTHHIPSSKPEVPLLFQSPDSLLCALYAFYLDLSLCLHVSLFIFIFLLHLARPACCRFAQSQDEDEASEETRQNLKSHALGAMLNVSSNLRPSSSLASF